LRSGRSGRRPDTASTAILLYVTTHAFDPDFHGEQPPADAKLVRAAQLLFRRAVGITEPPPAAARTTRRRT
jgi:hypothetical protein